MILVDKKIARMDSKQRNKDVIDRIKKNNLLLIGLENELATFEPSQIEKKTHVKRLCLQDRFLECPFEDPRKYALDELAFPSP